jgi:PAS domain S-box-containing protein
MEAAALVQLHRLSMRLTATSDLASLLYEVLDAAMELQHADFGDVQLYNESSNTLKMVAHRGLNQQILDRFKTVGPNDISACAAALRSGSRVVIEDMHTCADFAVHRGLADTAGFRGAQSTPLHDHGNGKLVGMLSTMFRKPYKPSQHELWLTDLYARQAADVIASRLSERALRASEQRLQAAIDLVKLGRYTWKPRTNRLQWDDRLREMWGLPADTSADYRVWRGCIHPDDRARVDAAVNRCIDPRGDGTCEIEFRVIGKSDGVERWIATQGRTDFENGAPVSFFGVALDITERKRIERDLEDRVEARTRELGESNRQLRAQVEQRKIAEAEVHQLQRLDAIGQITSGIAHDFNNLLSVVLINARLLSGDNGNPDDQESIQLIRAAAQRGVDLTTQLLAFSRRQRLEARALDLNSKVVAMSNLLNATLGGTVQLHMTLAADLWPALVDATQIESTILNLVINARDAMSTGGTLTLETFNAVIEKEPVGPGEPDPGRYVGLAVRDTGAGIPDDILPRVFEPFFTTKPPGKGSGLGLAQVFGFARQSGGGVQISTHPGEGSTVTVFLPREEPIRRVREAGPQACNVSTGRPKARVLLVDDDPQVLRSTFRLVNSLGYETIPVASGGQALDHLAGGQSFDVVLADYAMPQMTGAELAKAIEATHPALPVIIVTGYHNREALAGFGEDRIIHKPFTVESLVEKIEAAVNKTGIEPS